jgi:hypothetical protein
VIADGRQVEAEEHQQIVERVAAIDVAKASGMVCTRVPHQTTPGKRITRVWEVAGGCCVTARRDTLELRPPPDQMANASSWNAAATRRFVGSSAASS